MNPDEYRRHIRELSGPRPLCRVTDVDSKPLIWNRNTRVISFEAQPTAQIMGGGKDHNPAKLRPTECSYIPARLSFDFIELCYMDGHRY